MKRKKDVSGLIFSAFMITAFVICSYFFLGLIDNSTALGEMPKHLFKALVCAVFGGLLFYATRIGDGRQVKRFSVATLILLDLPALYIILASAAQGLPFPLDLTKTPEMVMLAGVALGYGIPYTFLSGYELDADDKKDKQAESDESVEEKAEDADSAEETDEQSELTDGEADAKAQADNGITEETAAEAQDEAQDEAQEEPEEPESAE